MTGPTLATQGLTHRYGSRRGIQDLNLEVSKGSIFGFLGPNGAGKTTTIRILLGFLRPNLGRALILGRDCWSQSSQIKRDVGYLPGDLRLYPWMTGTTALDLVGQVRGQDLRGPAAELMERFRLERGVSVAKMSRGMRQKLGLIMALAPKPRVLLLDEPTAALDPLMQDELLDYLREAAREGATVFFSSHSLAEVERLCDRIAILRDGSVVANETIGSLRSQAARSVVLTFRDRESAANCPPPPCLAVQERRGLLWRCQLQAPPAELLEWLPGKSVDDITIGPPDLEAIFREFYRSPSKGN